MYIIFFCRMKIRNANKSRKVFQCMKLFRFLSFTLSPSPFLFIRICLLHNPVFSVTERTEEPRIWWLQTKISGMYLYMCHSVLLLLLLPFHIAVAISTMVLSMMSRARGNVHINAGLSADVHCSHKKQIVCFTSFLWGLAWRHNFCVSFRCVCVCEFSFFISYFYFIFLLIYFASI